MSYAVEQSATIRTFLVMKNRLLRDMLARMLGRRQLLDVVGSCNPSQATAATLIDSGCDVVLLDFIDAEWLSLIRSHSQARGVPSLKIVAVGMDGDCERFLEAVRNGVISYLLEDASSSDVLAALYAVARDGAVCPPQLCMKLFQIVAQIPESLSTKQQERGNDLTTRQLRLMSFVCNGLTNKEIARELGLSEYTVKNHISRILKRLNAENRSEAARVVRACSQTAIERQFAPM